MNKRQRKKKYPKSCDECGMMTIIKEKELFTNNGCGNCINRAIADAVVAEICKKYGIKSI